MDKREKKGLALGAIVGAVVGVITGILFAPKSGKETRQDIKEATSKAAEKLSAEAHKIQEEALELIAKAEVRLKSLKGATLAKVNQHIDEVKHTSENVKSVAKAFKSGKSSDKDLDEAIKQAKAARDALKTFLKK